MAEPPQKYSGYFAIGSGVVLFAFAAGAGWYLWNQPLGHLKFWFFYLLVLWSGAASACLIVWGLKAFSKYSDGINDIKARLAAGIISAPVAARQIRDLNWIGLHTLEMIGGLSAAVIAAMTLALLFMDTQKTSKSDEALQTEVLEKQDEALHALKDIKAILAEPKPQPPNGRHQRGKTRKRSQHLCTCNSK
jgi:hypothetical protein